MSIILKIDKKNNLCINAVNNVNFKKCSYIYYLNLLFDFSKIVVQEIENFNIKF